MGKALVALAAALLYVAIRFVRQLRKRRRRERIAMAEWQRELDAIEQELASKTQ